MGNIINPNEPFFQISQVAKILEITSDRLRTYEEEGLIKPFRINDTKKGKRLFSQNDIDYIALIRKIIKLGVSIPTLRILLKSELPVETDMIYSKDKEIIILLKKLKEFK